MTREGIPIPLDDLEEVHEAVQRARKQDRQDLTEIINLAERLRFMAVTDTSDPSEWFCGQKTDYKGLADNLEAAFGLASTKPAP